jgi:hypothetical protein
LGAFLLPILNLDFDYPTYYHYNTQLTNI